MKRTIRPDAKLVQPFTYTQQQLPTDDPVVQYIRQSTDTQVKHNKQSTILQDEQLARRLVAMGFATIIKIDTDQGKSGQKRRDEREGLDQLYKLIESRKAGAIAAFSPSRLYRDLTRVYYTEFVHMCEEYAIPVITWQRIYWPNSRQDMDALLDKFAEAARFIDEEIHGKLLPARLQAIEDSISYGGHAVPMGYIVVTTEERKYYQVYEPHAKLIKWLFKRYKQLGGNLARLSHELHATGFAFPAFSGVDKIPHVGLRFINGCYPLKTRGALVSILTNPAYIGWYCYSRQTGETRKTARGNTVPVYETIVISKEAHAGIVPLDDFLYAYNRLSPTTLDGEVNEQKPAVDRRYGAACPALLENILTSNGNPVYVIDTCYEAKIYNNGWACTELAVPVSVVDTAFTDAMLRTLAALEQRHRDGLQDSLRERLTAMQQEKAVEVITLDSQLAATDKAIAGWELDKVSCRETGNKPGLDEANRQLKRLHADRSAVALKAQEAETEETTLQEIKSLHAQAVQDWSSLKFDNQKRFVRLLVASANITEVSPHVLQLEILLRAPLEAMLVGFIYRKHGRNPGWTPEECQVLRHLYPSADRRDILQALPIRSWVAVTSQASFMHLSRTTWLNTSGIVDTVAYQDALLLQETGLEKDGIKWFVSQCANLDMALFQSFSLLSSDIVISLSQQARVEAQELVSCSRPALHRSHSCWQCDVFLRLPGLQPQP